MLPNTSVLLHTLVIYCDSDQNSTFLRQPLCVYVQFQFTFSHKAHPLPSSVHTPTSSLQRRTHFYTSTEKIQIIDFCPYTVVTIDKVWILDNIGSDYTIRPDLYFSVVPVSHMERPFHNMSVQISYRCVRHRHTTKLKTGLREECCAVI